MIALFPLLGWLFETTVKGSVVIVLIALMQRLLAGRVAAQWRHALWLVVLLRLALPIAPSSSWSIFNLLPAQSAAPLTIRAAVTPAPIPPPFFGGLNPEVEPLRAMPFLEVWRWLAAIWIGGVIALAVRALIATIHVHIAVRRAPQRDHADPFEVVEDTRRRLGIRRPVRVVECNIVKAPALHGFFRPTMLLPNGLLASFDRDELRHVVLHELWHLRRLDVGLNWVLAAVQALHWFNPFVWFAVARIQEERELACDELALSCLEEEERFGYGRTILKLLETFRAASPVPALVGIVNHKQKMKRRLMMIATFRNRSRFSMLFIASLIVAGAVGLTDARGGDRRIVRNFDPATARTIERLDQRVTLDLKNASFGELLNAVANKTGVSVTQSPEVATSRVQQARFTIHAENIPGHALLMETLMPFQLAPQPDAKGVTIANGPSCVMMMHGDIAAAGHPAVIDEDVIIGDHGPVGAGEKRILIRTNGPAECKITADGNLHRELTLNIEENGVTSEAKLILDISGVNAK
ncbi:MAG TPA: M56 family metallopeptidase [Thermoanaerobaculia bacterium]|jgi:bla regulator protein BlaR1|nr:M56 family metallopeptidase [Thermoanaerobaculia bacterium]